MRFPGTIQTCKGTEAGDFLISQIDASFTNLLSNIDESRHFSKIQNGRHKQRSSQHTLARQKNIQKNIDEKASIQPLPSNHLMSS
jgi:hypothetical protein